MIEKSLIVIIFMYSLSFAMLGVQYTLADTFGITLTNWEGVELKSVILTTINEDSFNLQTGQLNNLNQTLIETDPITAAASFVYELFQILTGTYIFNVLALMLPSSAHIFIVGMVGIYAIMLFRTLIAYLRGV